MPSVSAPSKDLLMTYFTGDFSNSEHSLGVVAVLEVVEHMSSDGLSGDKKEKHRKIKC